jgi:glycerol uptake facilitator-like aquaporin
VSTPAVYDSPRRLIAEALGTAFLLATVIGSGIMAERLADGNLALALLCNTIPTGAILTVLILMLGPVSGAHFNPAVTLSLLLQRDLALTYPHLFTTRPLAIAQVGRAQRGPTLQTPSSGAGAIAQPLTAPISMPRRM